MKKEEPKIEYDSSDEVDTGAYISGHPDIDDQIPHSAIIVGGEELFVAEHEFEGDTKQPIKYGSIRYDKITNIVVEDASTLEKRVTLGRVLLVGIFALAWKKKDKSELAYLIIEWTDKPFDHSTVFQYEGKDSIQRANIARNQLIREYKAYQQIQLQTEEVSA